MEKKLLRKRIAALVLALVVMFTTCMPALEARAEESDLPAAMNTTFDKARQLMFDSSTAEEMTNVDNIRYYKFTLDAASEIVISGTFSNSYKDEYITIFDKDLTPVWSKRNLWINDDFSYTAYLTGGSYYLKIESMGDVTFTASKNALKESFTETQTKNNDVIRNASNIDLEKKYKGVLAANDSLDYFKFTVPAKGTISFHTTNSTSNKVKYLFYNKNKNLVYSFFVGAGNKTTQEFALAAGTYYLAVTQYSEGSGVGSYNFTIDYSVSAPKKPTLSSVTNKSGKKLAIKWKKVSGISGYEVQYSTNKKFKSSVTKKTVASGKTSATYTKLKKGKTYYVRMRSYVKVDGKKVYSNWSKTKTVKIKK